MMGIKIRAILLSSLPLPASECPPHPRLDQHNDCSTERNESEPNEAESGHFRIGTRVHQFEHMLCQQLEIRRLEKLGRTDFAQREHADAERCPQEWHEQEWDDNPRQALPRRKAIEDGSVI